MRGVSGGGRSIRIERVILDAGSLGKLARRRPRTEVLAWVDELTLAGIDILIPEITDYEIRRNLLLEGLTESIEALDRLRMMFHFIPITSSVMMQAAEFWAYARRVGRPTAGARELDCDVVLAAQAVEARATIATENLQHLSLFTDARRWEEIRPGGEGN